MLQTAVSDCTDTDIDIPTWTFDLMAQHTSMPTESDHHFYFQDFYIVGARVDK